MTVKRNSIEMIAARLQSLPPTIRWLYAQEGLVQATALGYAPGRGPWSRAADHLIRLSSRFGFARIVAAAANLSLLMVFYVRQSLVRQVPADGALFVGIGALREPKLVREFEATQGMPVVHLNEM